MLISSKTFKIIALAAALLICGCATTYNPATKRNEFILIDTESEVSMGRQMDKEVQKEFKLVLDRNMQDRLDKIGAKVAAVSDRQDLIYQFKVIEDKELNAFTIPGGYVYVNSGLMETATDDELAGVLGHEVGHIAAKHAVKKLQADMGFQLVMSIAMGASNQQTMGQAMGIVYDLAHLGYSRKDETLADSLSVKYSKNAGFDPRAIITFMEKLQAEHEKRGPNVNLVFLSSHPAIEDRIRNISAEIAALEYEEKIRPKTTD
jgi:predicted Zn-dependent protease